MEPNFDIINSDGTMEYYYILYRVCFLFDKKKMTKLSRDCLCLATVIKFYLFSREQRKNN